MENKILYTFTVYLRNPLMESYASYPSQTTSAVPHWDVGVSVFATTVEEAIENIPECYKNWRVVNVHYPIGYPNFPTFPSSTTTAGAVGVNSMTGELYLR